MHKRWQRKGGQEEEKEVEVKTLWNKKIEEKGRDRQGGTKG